MPKNKHARNRVRQDLLRAIGNLEWVMEHLNRCLTEYEPSAPIHGERARLLMELTLALGKGIEDLRNDT